MDILWAPWRIKYINNKKEKKCIFCQAAKKAGESYCLFKTRHSVSMLNIFPYNNGHAMIAPLRHIRDFTPLKQDEILDLFAALNKTKCLLDKVLKPDGYNIGINISKSAGAGITGHMHIHIVPRWIGDTNFMTVIDDTRVIPESLGALYKKLKNAESKTNKRV